MVPSLSTAPGAKQEPRKRRVLVTGFAPFQRFTINASFEVARLLDRLEGADYHIEAWPFSIKTEYDYVSQIVPRLWREKFDLIVHIGIASGSVVRVEQRARREPYINADNAGRFPTKPLSSVLPEEVFTDLPLDDVEITTNARLSKDAGLYLCEYIYFHSLVLAKSSGRKVLFIHVPPSVSPAEYSKSSETVVQVLDGLMKYVPLDTSQSSS